MPRIPLGDWVNSTVDWLLGHVSWLFDFFKTVFSGTYDGINAVLQAPEPLLLAGIFAVLAFWLRGTLAGVLTFVGFAFIDSLELWDDAMVTLSLRVENPNAIELMVQSLQFGLSIKDIALTRGATVQAETIAAGGYAVIQLETRTDMYAVLQVIALSASGRLQSLQYALDGEAIVQNGIRLPFARRGDIPLPGASAPAINR